MHSNTSNKKTLTLSILFTFGVSFFIWGFLTVLNTVFTQHLKEIFNLSYSISTLIQLTFFSTYLLVSLPSGKLIRSWGYKLGLIIGLFTTGMGCMLFYFAIYLQHYYFFLLALVVQATGITLLQVGANLYIIFFGKFQHAASRLTLMQGLNALGAFLAPIYGSEWAKYLWDITLDMDVKVYLETITLYVESPYIILSIIMYLLTIYFVFVDIPEFNTSNIIPQNKPPEYAKRVHVMHFRQLRLGAFAVFAYLGAEVALGNFLVNFFNQFTEYYWGGAMLGRFIGTIVLLKVSPRKALAVCSIGAISLLLISIITLGFTSLWAVTAIGICNSIMFPIIFTLGINGIGKYSEEGSSIMIMAFVGAGVIPFNVVNFAAGLGYKVSFILPLICYAYILFYALNGSKFTKREELSSETVT